MDDLESRLEHELSGLGRVPLAEPVPVDDLRRRARRVRAGRAITSFVAVATAAAVVVAVVVATRDGSPAARPRKVQVVAPGFVLGDIDAVVQSSAFDADGARSPLPAGLAAVVARVPGVQRVSGVVDTFIPLNAIGIASPDSPPQPPRSPILFSYHEPDEVNLVSGHLPRAANEILVDADFVSRTHFGLGDGASFQLRGERVDLTIVGTFALPDVDLTGIPLGAMAAEHQPPDLELDRLDVKLAPGAAAANVRNAIALAIGNGYTVAAPSVISFPDQRLAQLEIQHAYWSLLSPDPIERGGAVQGPKDPNSQAEYQKHASETPYAELRVENVTFVSPDVASLTYRVFYSGSPSPIVHDPQQGAAVRVDGKWKLTSSTVCALAEADHLPCPNQPGYGASGTTTTTPGATAPRAATSP